MKKAVWVLLLGVAVAYALVCLMLFVFQRKLIYAPQPRAIQAPESTMSLEVGDAQLVVSVIRRPGTKAVLYFGGNAEDVSLNLPVFEKAFPEHAVYLLHYRGYGGSSGTPTEENNHRDAAALLAKVQAQHPQVVLVGRSLGSGVAIRLASEAPVAKLVLITPYDSIANIAAATFPWVPVSALLLDRYDSWRFAPLVKVPTTVVMAEHDEVIPRASTENLLRHFASGVAKVVVIPAAGHNTLQQDPTYLKALHDAL